jgi:hypothetical protein
VIRVGSFVAPDGRKVKLANLTQQRYVRNFYWTKLIRPWFINFISPWVVRKMHFYLRGHMLYWGAVITSTG